MATLSDKDIKEKLERSEIELDPFPNLKEQLGPASLDLRLGRKARLIEHQFEGIIDPKNKETIEGSTKLIEIKKYFFLHKDEVILAETKEFVTMPNDLCARVEGRSSLGRLFVGIHSTAGFVDPGFKGRVTLELKNDGLRPVKLYPGMRICQIVFETMSSEVDVNYGEKENSKYYGDKGPSESRIWKDFKKE